MKLTKKQLAEPFDIKIFYPKRMTHTAKIKSNQYMIWGDGEIRLLGEHNNWLFCKCKTNAHFIYIADALGILNKDEWL